jgi:hypothetical protein
VSRYGDDAGNRYQIAILTAKLHRVGRLTAVTGATSMAIDSGGLRSNLSAT